MSDEFNNHVRSISFYTAREGYVAFWNWVGFTTDSGRTYTKKYISDANIDRNGYTEWNDVGFWIHGVKAFSRDTILVYGQLDDHASVLYSTNGGNNFKVVFYSWYTAYIRNYILDMSFAPNSNIGYALDNDRILKTTNRGLTWSTAASDSDAAFHSVQAISNNEVIAVARDNIYKTVNGAAPFTKLPIPQGWLRGAYFLTSSKGWAAIDDYIYYTSDGGNIWVKKNTIDQFFTRLHFINDSTGFGLAESYTVYKTTDSGKVWEPVIRDNQFNSSWGHTQFFFLDNNQFWVGGDGGLLELSTNGGGITQPKAFFRIDTANVNATNKVNLFSLSKPQYQHKWYRNDTLIGAGLKNSYTHYLYDAIDTVKLVVINGALTDTLIQYQLFDAPPRPAYPVITSFTPVTGPEGTIVSISGNNLTGATSVTFGGVRAASFTIISTNLIRAVIGNGASGYVTVTTPIGTAVRPGFTWFIPFAIRSFAPAMGPVGSQVTIKGNHFSTLPANNIVYFGAVRSSVLSASDTQLVVTVPPGATYSPISVTTNGLTAFSRLSFLLTFEGGGPITVNSFPFKVDSSADSHAYLIHTDDIDGDGKPDIIMSNYERIPNALMISRNTSTVNNVSFDPIQYVPNAERYTFVFGVTTGDINGDGKKDIITSDPYSGAGIFISTSTTGNISFAPRIRLPGQYGVMAPHGIIDFEGDGKPDLFGVEGGRISVFKNNSSGTNIQFTPVNAKMVSTEFSDCAATDFDGDGKPDIISHGPQSVLIYRNVSNGGVISFAATEYGLAVPNGHNFSRLAVGDLDNDGKPDLAVREENDFIAVFRNTSSPGQLNFSPPLHFEQPIFSPHIAIGDMNGDGKADIVLSTNEGPYEGAEDPQMSILENTSTMGNINFAPIVTFGNEVQHQNTISHVIVDIDGDGKNDIVTHNAAAMDFSVFINQQGISLIKICDNGSTTLSSNLPGASYQWQRNVSGTFTNITDNTYFSGTNTKDLHLNKIPVSWNGYEYRCLVNGNPGKVFRVAVDTFSRPEVTITTDNLAVCAGAPVTFTATATKAGKTPHYQWQVNGVAVGSDTNKLMINTLNNNDKVRVIITGSLLCHAPEKDTSNVLTINVHNLTVTPKVTIEASDTTICAGEKVTFRAITENAGADPQFYWRYLVINAPGSTDSSIYTTPELTSSGSFYLVMVSNAACASPAEVTSNQVFIKVQGRDFPTIEINASAAKICFGNPVTFTTTTTHAGPNPQFLWKHNAAEVSTGSSYITNSITNGDKISASMISSDECITTPYAYSNTVTMEVSNSVTPTVSVMGNNLVDQGQSTTLTATFTHGGSTPGLQWQDSTATHGWANITGAINTTLTYSPLATGIKVRCILTSNAACATITTVNSAALLLTVNAPTGVNPVPADNYGIRFSPNPVYSFFIVDKLRLADQWESLEIISAEGRQPLIRSNIKNQTMVNVYAHSLRSGFYVAVLRKRNGESVYVKFVKM